MSEVKNFRSRKLYMSSLKPSDFYLYQQGQDFFNFDMRDLFVLGLRVVYAGLHGQITRDQILDMAQGIHEEDLNTDSTPRPQYRAFYKIPS